MSGLNCSIKWLTFYILNYTNIFFNKKTHLFTSKTSLPCRKYQFLLPPVSMGSEWTDGIWRSCGKMQSCDLHIWTKNVLFVCVVDICCVERNIHKIQLQTTGWSYGKVANFACLSTLFVFAMRNWGWYVANLPFYSPPSLCLSVTHI